MKVELSFETDKKVVEIKCNGKVIDNMPIEQNVSSETLEQLGTSWLKVKGVIREDQPLKRVVVVPNKSVNVIT